MSSTVTDYAYVAVAVIVLTVVTIAYTASRPRTRRVMLAALLVLAALGAGAVYYVHHMWDDLKCANIFPPVR
jgi:hypothetical protein